MIQYEFQVSSKFQIKKNENLQKMGSVKVTVFGRIKPCSKNLLSQEFRLKYGDHEDYITFASTRNSTGKKCYRFQKIFGADASQEQVFESVAKPVIKNVLTGYNGTIFTYGQTGSGKTYTMTGDIEQWVHPGLIPRTIQEIFKAKGKDTVLSITYCEIYNEHVYDLIRVDRIDSDLPQVSLLEDSSGITHFRNLSVHVVKTAYEALQLLIRGDANKMVAETTSNAKSSRSHVIFSIALDLPHPTQEKLCLKPVLYLVDLAGSEKLSKCKASMTNPWETRYINLSLHYLEQVLVALRQPGRVHIPYRNSLMTALLRNSLGGNCITAMIATFSLAVDDVEETIQTCRFAERIALIKNEVKLNEIASPEKEIDLLKRENERLKAQLKLMSNNQSSEELSEEDKDKCAEMVKNYIQDSDCFDLPLCDIRRMEYCFWLMREEIYKRETNKTEDPRTKSDLDILKICSPVKNQSLQIESSKVIPLKSTKNMEKYWKRKRNPVEIPKVNITYKRWRSTETLSEKESCVSKKFNNNETTRKEINLVKDESKDIKISPELPLLEQNDGSDSFVLAGCFLKQKSEDILPRRSFSNVRFVDDTEKENENIIAVRASDSSTKLFDPNPIFRVMAQNENISGQRFSFGTLKNLISIGINMEDVQEIETEKEKEVDFLEPINLDQVSLASNESSHFSSSCLPLTGDAEVDEEIIKFYKARYDLYKNEEM